MYTILKLAKMAGVSTRTLRYYDEIELLKPARINTSGYRVYGQEEVDRLQQILFFRELDFNLDKIKEMLDAPDFDAAKALAGHREMLLERRKQLDILINNVEKTIKSLEGRIKIRNHEKFEGLKKELVEENERRYGKEIREKYGEEAVDSSNKKLLNLTKEQYEQFERLGSEVLDTLEAAFETGDPAGDLAQKACELHKQWLMFVWKDYSKQRHAGLAQMYVDDERFTAFYDTRKPGMAKFFRDALMIYTGMDA